MLTVRTFFKSLQPFIQATFQETCLHCRSQIATSTLSLCTECQMELSPFLKKIRFESTYVSEMWALGSYRSPLGSLIRSGKYGRRVGIFKALGDQLAGAALDLPEMDAVLSIPMPMKRHWDRGFNQSRILTERVGSLLGIDQYEILYRTDGVEQASKSISERQLRLTGRFEVRPHFPKDAIPRTVLLVDDVITSGNTIESCALELLNAGVQKVYAIAVASVK